MTNQFVDCFLAILIDSLEKLERIISKSIDYVDSN